MTAFATQSNIDMSGPGLLGSDVVGSSRRKSKRITIGTGLTLSGGVLSNSLDLSGYVQKTSATGSLILPSGTTAERDGSPAAGYSRWNTTTSRFERWTGSVWENYVRLSGDTMTGALSLGSNTFTSGAITSPSISASSGNTSIGTSSGKVIVGSWLEIYPWSTNNVVFNPVVSSGALDFGRSGGAGTWLRVGFQNPVHVGSAYSLGFTSANAWDAIDAGWVRGAAGVVARRNGLNAQCDLINKSYTSDTSQEALMLDAGKQISGKLGLYSYRGSSGGSNYPIQIGMLAADGSTFSGLSVLTSGDVNLPSRRITSVGTVGVIIEGDVSTGSMPLRIQTGSTVLYDFGFSGTLSLVPAVSVINVGSGVMHVATATGNRALVKSYANLELSTGALGGGGTYVEINNGTAGTYRDLLCRSITQVPPSSVTLATNGQFSIEMTSNTAGNLVYRGSDGTTRRMALTFS